MDVININDKRKQKSASSSSTYRVKINFFNVKYLEDVQGTKTRVHFLDGSSLLINRAIESTNEKMKLELKR